MSNSSITLLLLALLAPAEQTLYVAPRGEHFARENISLLLRAPSKGTVFLRQGRRVYHQQSFSAGDAHLRWRQPQGPGLWRFYIKSGDSAIKTPAWRTAYRDLLPKSRGKDVLLLQRIMRRQGYRNVPASGVWNQHMSAAVLAARKQMGMAYTERANNMFWKKLLRQEARFIPRVSGRGKWVEADIGKGTMALIHSGRTLRTYPITPGAPSTPSDEGRFIFYRKEPGYNHLGMYYSVYYNRGEATHGYAELPPDPASHGCLRNPLTSSREIYRWIDLGTPIWVYR